MHARRYTILVLAIVSTLAGSIAAFNLSVDPYLLWRDSGHVGFAGDDLGRLTKAHWIDGYGADLVVLGNSHARGGFSEKSFIDRGLAERPFNGALPAGLIYELRRYFQHYAEMSELRSAVVVIDILNFLDIAPVGGAFHENRLSVTAEGAPNPRWWLDDLVFTNLTVTGLKASVDALFKGTPVEESLFSGFRVCTPEPTGNRPNRAIAFLGANYQRFLSGAYLDEATTFDWRAELTSLFEEAARRHIKLFVVIPPAHVTYYMELEAAGYWPAYLSIAEEAARLAERAGGDIAVFDFTGFSKVQTESLRPGKPLTFWRDTNHFSCHAGDMMLARLAGDPVKVKGFGRQVTADTAETHTDRINAQKRSWQNGNREEYCRYLKMMPGVVPDTTETAC